MVQAVKNLPAMQETQVQSLGQEVPWRRKWQPMPVFLPGESMDREARWPTPLGSKKSDTTEVT